MTEAMDILVQVLTAVLTWFSGAVNGMDHIMIGDFSVLSIVVALGVFDITWWGIMRIIDSPKSDA